MADLEMLVEGINRWRASNVAEYWVSVSYMGGELHRFGDHDLTFTQGKLWHQRGGEWRVIEKGSDFWLFSVPGAFAWARDILTKVLPEVGATPDMCVIRCHPEYGYIELLQVEVGHRAEVNFTFQVTHFGVGRHPDFDGG